MTIGLLPIVHHLLPIPYCLSPVADTIVMTGKNCFEIALNLSESQAPTGEQFINWNSCIPKLLVVTIRWYYIVS